MNAARGGGGEQPVLEDRQVEHRRAAVALDQHEERQQDDAGDEPADRRPGRPSRSGRRGRCPSTRPVSPTTNITVPEHVEAAHAVGLGQLAQDERRPQRAGEAERAR